MEQWQREAEFVMNARTEDEAHMLSDDDRHRTRRKAHDAFQMKWGFSELDIPDLDQAIAMFILPRLAFFITQKDSIPNKLAEDNPALCEKELIQEWNRILQTICDGLHLYIEKYPTQFSYEENEKWFIAKKYLFEYFEHLWI